MEQKKVLFADDDPDFREFMIDAIEEVGKTLEIEMTVSIAKDGNEAIAKFNKARQDKNSFDFVVTDFMMPTVSGVEVIRHIMKTSPVPIIAISGVPEAENVDFITEGAIIYVKKPMDMTKMIEAFQSAISLSLSGDDIRKAEAAINRLEGLIS